MRETDYIRLVSVLVILGLTLFLSEMAGNDIEAYSAYNTSQQGYAETKRVNPVGADPEVKLTDPKSYRDEYRSEYDLQAQRAMAFWTKWIAIFTFVGVILIGITLYFTGRTLSEARKTTDAANATIEETRRIGEAQVRAYVTVQNAEMRFDYKGLFIDLSLINTGQSPGVITAGTGELLTITNADISENDVMNIKAKGLTCDFSEYDIGKSIPPQKSEDVAIGWLVKDHPEIDWVMRSPKERTYVQINVTIRDVFKDETPVITFLKPSGKTVDGKTVLKYANRPNNQS